MNRPYSFSLRPLFRAMFLSAMTWSFDPVKYTRAAPYSPPANCLTSTCTPSCSLTLARFGPLSRTCATAGHFDMASMALGSVDSRSRSPTVLLPLRRLPAIPTLIPSDSKYACRLWKCPSASGRSILFSKLCSFRTPVLNDSSTVGPNSASSLPASSAFWSSSTLVMPSSCESLKAVLGPIP